MKKKIAWSIIITLLTLSTLYVLWDVVISPCIDLYHKYGIVAPVIYFIVISVAYLVVYRLLFWAFNNI